MFKTGKKPPPVQKVFFSAHVETWLKEPDGADSPTITFKLPSRRFKRPSCAEPDDADTHTACIIIGTFHLFKRNVTFRIVLFVAKIRKHLRKARMVVLTRRARGAVTAKRLARRLLVRKRFDRMEQIVRYGLHWNFYEQCASEHFARLMDARIDMLMQRNVNPRRRGSCWVAEPRISHYVLRVQDVARAMNRKYDVKSLDELIAHARKPLEMFRSIDVTPLTRRFRAGASLSALLRTHTNLGQAAERFSTEISQIVQHFLGWFRLLKHTEGSPAEQAAFEAGVLLKLMNKTVICMDMDAVPLQAWCKKNDLPPAYGMMPEVIIRHHRKGIQVPGSKITTPERPLPPPGEQNVRPVP